MIMVPGHHDGPSKCRRFGGGIHRELAGGELVFDLDALRNSPCSSARFPEA